MSASRVYLAVEGPHDVELVAALLRPDGFKRVQHRSRVEAFWDRLIPKDFPYNDDLLARVPVPLFFARGESTVAVQGVGGESRIVEKVEETLVSVGTLSGVGAILDADSEKLPEARFDQVAAGLRKQRLPVPPAPGEVSSDSPRCGIYVLPDNRLKGTLEDLLLECGGIVYPGLLHGARSFVDSVDLTAPELANDDLKDFAKGAGRNKATLASIASILRPGKAIQNSIQDNRWLKDPRALALPRVSALRQFLRRLLDLPSS